MDLMHSVCEILIDVLDFKLVSPIDTLYICQAHSLC